MIYVIGAGYMAKEYLRVVKKMGLDAKVVSRTKSSARAITSEFGIECYDGGYAALNIAVANEDVAVVCTPVEKLFLCTKSLINLGFKKILVEKPGALNVSDLEELKNLANASSCKVFIAYNRRFFSSVQYLRKILETEELIAVNFEISEWTHRIVLADYSSDTLNHWFVSNTSHVVDLVFDIAGIPDELSCYTSGSLEWHPSASRFSGSGHSNRNVLMNYHGYWDAPGRWSVEFMTPNNKYILRPMEKLSCQKKGSVEIADIDGVDYGDDEMFKPGVLKMFQCFNSGDYTGFCDLHEQIERIKIYNKMANY
jgi:predicted dehydrogenase